MRVSYQHHENNFTSESAYPLTIYFTSPLLLHANPTHALHAASKQYVDTVLSYGLDTNNITTGLVPTASLPSFHGDVKNEIGSPEFLLQPTNITPGTYTKIITNTKGLIVGTGNIALEDIPVLNWNKIDSNKPTTLSGYGITDGISLNGDTLPGTLKYSGPHLENLNPLTRKSLTELTSTLLDTNEPIGVIVERTKSTGVTGFLRCNGGVVTTAMYGNLFAVIGDQYNAVPGSVPGSFTLPDMSALESQGKYFFIRF